MFRHTLIAISAAGLLAACTQDGRVQENTVGGAVLGGIAGAVTGAIIGDRKGAIIGAGIGAIAGAGIGNYLDQQQAELEKNLEGTGATVTNTGEALLVNLPSEITFDVDSAAIKPEFQGPVRKIADTLREYESSYVDVIGHTDSTGSDAYNQRLSRERANRVAAVFIRRGVIRERIVAVGKGESEPIATNATAEGRAQNRRVEIIITPITNES